jgi:carbon starvation protein
MNIFSKILWGIVSLAAAVSMAVVVGIFHPSEKVNALWIVTAAGCFFAVSYRFYSAFIAAKVLALDQRRVTPAMRLNDGIDFDPTNKWVLFGHHFAAIAGAGPLIGPMLAAQFGYAPGFLWILIGAALAGAVHDMVLLTASIRRNGHSLAQIAKDEVGPVGGVAASIAILFIIIVALAGLGFAVVNALKENPWGTFTIGLTIPIALLMGFYLRFARPGKVGEVSVIGVVLMLLAVYFGGKIPGTPFAHFFTLSDHQLVWSLALYGFIASVLPVWMLLCPRDYLSTYMKVGTIAMLALGVVFMAPILQMPAVTKFAHGGGPIIPGRLFPFMFITIACGAISGFHALIASGTTPKMIMSERHIRPIGYGAMVTEGFVSMMALIAACILIPGDYFAINTKLSFDAIAALGFPVDQIKELSAMVGLNVQGRPGGAVSLAVGMTTILSHIPGMKGLMPYWFTFALMFEALFILTTVDAGTRVARFLIQEFGNYAVKHLSKKRKLVRVISWIVGSTYAVLCLSFFTVLYRSALRQMFPPHEPFVAALIGSGAVLCAGITGAAILFLYNLFLKSRYRWLNSTIFSSLLVVLAWGYLIYSGNISTIWPMFGVSNQLLAAIALGVGTTLIIKSGKVRYVWVTGIPMVFMFVTTFTASWQLMNMFRGKALKAATAPEAFNFNLDAGLVALMALLAVIALADMIYKWYGYLSKTRAITSSEVVEYSAG